MPDVLLEIERDGVRVMFYMRDDGYIGISIQRGTSRDSVELLSRCSLEDLQRVVGEVEQRQRDRARPLPGTLADVFSREGDSGVVPIAELFDVEEDTSPGTELPDDRSGGDDDDKD